MYQTILLFSQSWLWLPSFYIFGICIGSFLNVYAWRYPQMMHSEWARDISAWFEEKGWDIPFGLKQLSESTLTLSNPGSFCPHCNTPISWKYNIPVLGYFFLKGRSACCQKSISFKYPFYENLVGVLSLAVGWQFHSTPVLALFMVLITWFFCAISLIDLDSMIIPDTLLASLFFLILITQLTIGNSYGFNYFPTIQKGLWGFLFGFSSLFIIRFLGFVILKKEAMGMADPKLLALIGFLTGPIALIWVLLIASLSALLAAVVLRLKAGNPIPFGPFLCIGGYTVLLDLPFWNKLLLP